MTGPISTSIAYTPYGTAAATLTVGAPPAYLEGGLLVMVAIGGGASSVYPETPDGWTAQSSGEAPLGVFTRTASASESSYPVTFSGDCAAQVLVAAYPAATAGSTSFQSSASGVLTYSPTFPSGVESGQTVLMAVGSVTAEEGSAVPGDYGSTNISLPSAWTPVIYPFGATVSGTEDAANAGLAQIQATSAGTQLTSDIASQFYAGFLVLDITGTASPLVVTVASGPDSTVIPGLMLTVKALSGAASPEQIQAGGAVYSAYLGSGTATAPQAPLTPNASGSYIYGALWDWNPTGAYTPNSATTFAQNQTDTTNAEDAAYGTFRTAAATSAGTPVTVGASGPDNSYIDIALAEILAASGETLSEIATAQVWGVAPWQFSAPGVIQQAIFAQTPAPGTLLVLTAVANSQYTANSALKVTDSLGLDWVQLASTDYPAYAGVWVAQIPGAVSATLAGEGRLTAASQGTGTSSLAATSSLTAAAGPAAPEFPAIPGYAAPGAAVPGSPGTAGPAPLQPTASLAARGALSAAPVATVPGAADLAARAALTAASEGTAGGAASLAGEGTVSAAAGTQTPYTVTVVNQWPLTVASAAGSGPNAVAVSNTPGNMLIAFIGWSSGYPATAVNPVSNVADDANDWWVHLGTSSAEGTGRVSVWACPATRRGPGADGGSSVVSVAASAYVAGLCALIVEVAGAPEFAVADFTQSGYVTSGTSLTVPGEATGADLVLAVAMGSTYGTALSGPGAGWNTLSQVTTDGYAPGDGDVVLAPAWQSAGAGSISATWSAASAEALAGVVAAISAVPPAPAQDSANWPALHAEAAFGYQPGNPAAIPSWTDITGRVIDAAGNVALSAKRGRSYELTQPEAGEIRMGVSNQDSAFDPENENSPYWPDVAVEMQVRSYAYWGGSFYGIGMGWTERIPQEWPHLPQWGMVPLVATDGIGVLANSSLPSALAGEYLIDAPQVYLPCGEEYATGEAESDEVYGSTNGGAAGQTLANLSRVNTTPGMCVNGIARTGTYPSGTGLVYYYLETGLTLGLASAVNNSPTGIYTTTALSGLLGDPGGGIGISVVPSTPAGPGWTASNGLFCGPGALYTDPGLPQPAGEATYCFWAIIAQGLPADFVQVLWRLEGAPWSYSAQTLGYSYGAIRLLVRYDTSNGILVDVADLSAYQHLVTYANTTLDDGNPHFYAVTITSAGGTYSASLYVDGALAASGTSTTITPLADVVRMGIGGAMSSSGGQITTWNVTLGHIAGFNGLLPPSRVNAFYQAGLPAWPGDTAPQRFGRILAWSGFGLASACDLGSPSPLYGPADQVQGQSAASAIYTVAQSDNGMLYCDGAGNVTYRSRAALYNRPVKWWFGDAPVPQGPLNANPYFGHTTSPWTPANGATLALSPLWSHQGSLSLQITGNGTSENPGAQSEQISVLPGVTYQVDGWCYSPQGWSAEQGGLQFTVSYWAGESLVSTVAGPVLGVFAQAQMRIPLLTFTVPGGENITSAQVTVQMAGTPGSGVAMLVQPVLVYCAEVPMEKNTSFGYDNTYLWNWLTATLQVNSAYDGSSATAIDTASQQQYFTRGGPDEQTAQTLETQSYQDVLDVVNWGLAKYSQPQLRMKQIVVDAASKASAIPVWPTVLGVEQGDIISVVRRPIGGVPVTETGIVQKVQHEIGPSRWRVTILVVPYSPADDVLTSDVNPVVGTAVLPW